MPRGRGIYVDEERDQLKKSPTTTDEPEEDPSTNKIAADDYSTRHAQEPPD